MPEIRQRQLSELEEQRPEFQAWLRPLRVSLDALMTETFRGLVPLCAQSRAADVPMLHDAIIPLPGSAARAHVHAVLHAALALDARGRSDSIDATLFLELAVAQDTNQLIQIADAIGVEAPALMAAAQLAVLPVLIACTRNIAPRPLETWGQRYCHVCGALPVAAEMLGLERARHLRCGRCGSSWKSQVLVCCFCGERDHARLGSLVPEGPEGQICWIETCETCRGYIKTRAALRPAAPDAVMIEDARTIELDLTAHERGYQKPAHGHFPTRVQLRTTSLAFT